MKKGTLILVLAMALVGLTGQAQAAETDTITVTVELETTVSVAITPLATPWAIGPIALEGTDASPTYTATNNGNVNIDLDIKSSDGANGWTVGTVGLDDVFQVDVTVPALTLSTTDQALTTNVAPAGIKTIDMTYTAPTTDTQGGGVDHSFTITVTASAS